MKRLAYCWIVGFLFMTAVSIGCSGGSGNKGGTNQGLTGRQPVNPNPQMQKEIEKHTADMPKR
jgi:hypothetical protein